MIEFPGPSPAATSATAAPLGAVGYAVLLAVLAYGVFLRAWDLGSRPFWVDEAESGINALTILEHGLPVDHYLGLPLYENTLTRPWPESEEYEFEDSSYSERGLAIYHGWLPLYAMAASFALSGVEPDRDPSVRTVRHSAEEMRRRTVVGRLPAVLFGAAFLLAIFFAARDLYGADAAWSAVTAGAVCTPAVEVARQARYYSAALALTAGCGLLIYRMAHSGRWRDYLPGALLLVLLFHTHLLSFVAASAILAGCLPWLLRRPDATAKVAALTGLVAVGTLPWVWWTGFATTAHDLPRAWSLLTPQDLWAFGGRLGLFVPLAAVALGWLAVAGRLRGLLPSRLTDPFADHRSAFLFPASWGIAALIVFVLFVPAVSFFYGRLLLTILVPGLLLATVIAAAVARVIAPRQATLLAPGLAVLALALSGQATFLPASEASPTFEVIERLRGFEFGQGSRLYATPNHHLVLTFYTGMPFQSAAPIRKSFLDRHEGEIVILEAGPRHELLTAEEIRQALSAAGSPSSEDEVHRLEQLLPAQLLREELRSRVASLTGPKEPTPKWLPALEPVQRQKTSTAVSQYTERTGNPMFRGHPTPDYLTCWQTFYYRFVDPKARTGPGLNYANRVREAEASVLPLGWVLYHCPARTGPRAPGPDR